MGTKYRKDTEATRWNHRPKEAVALNPLFEWPPKFLPILRWYISYWLAASTTTLALILSITAYFTILPSLDLMKNLHFHWIIRVWLANLVPHIICAGLLHFLLYDV